MLWMRKPEVEDGRRVVVRVRRPEVGAWRRVDMLQVRGPASPVWKTGSDVCAAYAAGAV